MASTAGGWVALCATAGAPSSHALSRKTIDAAAMAFLVHLYVLPLNIGAINLGVSLASSDVRRLKNCFNLLTLAKVLGRARDDGFAAGQRDGANEAKRCAVARGRVLHGIGLSDLQSFDEPESP